LVHNAIQLHHSGALEENQVPFAQLVSESSDERFGFEKSQGHIPARGFLGKSLCTCRSKWPKGQEEIDTASKLVPKLLMKRKRVVSKLAHIAKDHHLSPGTTPRIKDCKGSHERLRVGVVGIIKEGGSSVTSLGFQAAGAGPKGSRLSTEGFGVFPESCRKGKGSQNVSHIVKAEKGQVHTCAAFASGSPVKELKVNSFGARAKSCSLKVGRMGHPIGQHGSLASSTE
jgi:hypothetical protein